MYYTDIRVILFSLEIDRGYIGECVMILHRDQRRVHGFTMDLVNRHYKNKCRILEVFLAFYVIKIEM